MQQVLEGTWEEIKTHEAELAGKRLRVVICPPEQANAEEMKPPKRVSALGKYAGVLNSEEFMRRKHEETLLEDKPLR